MPGTYRKRIYMSLVHTDSFRQTPICAHSTQRVNYMWTLETWAWEKSISVGPIRDREYTAMPETSRQTTLFTDNLRILPADSHQDMCRQCRLYTNRVSQY